MKKILMLLCVGLLMSCGGDGGNDDEDIADFSGEWDATLTLTNDTCGWGVPDEETDVLTIEQAGSNLSVTFNDGTVSTGEIDDEDSFSVTQVMTFPDSDCTGIETSTFRLIDDTTAEITDAADVSCEDGAFTCQVEYGTGTAVRR